MIISEIFYSVQGEGLMTNKKAIFIRTAGCNLRCSFCDTKYAYKGKNIKKNKIISQIKKYPCRHVIWTGGEPTLQINEICKIISELRGYHHDIETNGTIFFPVELFDNVIISPKKQRLNIKLITKYKKYTDVYFKFVTKNKKDYLFWKKLIKNLNLPKDKIYFMPEAKDKETLIKKSKWLIKKTNQDEFNFSTRLQILKNFK